MNSQKLDVLYPLIQYEKGHEQLKGKVFYWLYDFQHKFLPELFTKEEITKRELNFRNVAEFAKNIVLSSHDSEDHLKQFYPNCRASIHVYNFVSLIEKKDAVLKIKVPLNYLVVCNQFWPHKNHIAVLKAIDLLVKNKKNIHVVFTGKSDHSPHASYVKELRNFISENKLEAYVTFTGFIAREEQVVLIGKAKAVVQPSLFEGWSTVIEDAKALNKFLIVSEIPIHKEQITSDVQFFKPDDVARLAEYMDSAFCKEMQIASTDYRINIRKAEADLATMLEIQADGK